MLQGGLGARRGGNNLSRSRMLQFGPKHGHMDLVVTVVGGNKVTKEETCKVFLVMIIQNH